MNKTFNIWKLLIFTALAAIVPALAGCGGVVGGNDEEQPEQEAREYILLDQYAIAVFDDADDLLLKAGIRKDISDITDLEWTSDDDTDNPVIDITGSGTEISLSFKRSGTVTITATLKPREGIDRETPALNFDNPEYPLSAECTVTVFEQPSITPASPGNIMLSEDNTLVSKILSAQIMPAKLEEYEHTVEWTISEGGDYAEIRQAENGIIYLDAKASGSGKVKVTLAVLGKVVEGEASWSVEDFNMEKIMHSAINITNKPYNLVETDTSGEFTITWTPDTASLSGMDLIYNDALFELITPDAENHPEVKKLKARSGSAGTYTGSTPALTALSKGRADVKDTLELTVTGLEITISGSADEIIYDGTSQLTAAVNAQDNGVQWESDNTAAATVNSNGLVSSKLVSGDVSVAITAKAGADALKTAVKTITIKPHSFMIAFNGNDNTGGTVPATINNVIYGTGAALPDNTGNLVKTGYQFGGWTKYGETTVLSTAADTKTLSVIPGGSATLYANWERLYVITYDAQGGTGGGTAHAVYGGVIPTFNAPSKTGYVFSGYFDDINGGGTKYYDASMNKIFALFAANDDITLYAKWTIAATSGAGLYAGTETSPKADTETLAKALTWLQNGAENSTTYTLKLDADDISSAQTLNAAAFNGKTGVKLILQGIGEPRQITLSGTGSLFTVAANTLEAGQDIILSGAGNTAETENTAALIRVEPAGTFILEVGAKVTGNRNVNTEVFRNGGGISVNRGNLVIKGGEVTDNAAIYGGGIHVTDDTALFTMTGGFIRGNRAADGGGGIIFVGTYGNNQISGGTISNNMVKGGIFGIYDEDFGTGGGIHMFGAVLTVSGSARIIGNAANGSADDGGGGIIVYSTIGASVFTFNGGIISGNTTTSSAYPTSYNFRSDAGSTFVNNSGQTCNNSTGFHISN